jgi:hypothetical protein
MGLFGFLAREREMFYRWTYSGQVRGSDMGLLAREKGVHMVLKTRFPVSYLITLLHAAESDIKDCASIPSYVYTYVARIYLPRAQIKDARSLAFKPSTHTRSNHNAIHKPIPQFLQTAIPAERIHDASMIPISRRCLYNHRANRQEDPIPPARAVDSLRRMELRAG